MRTAGIAIMIAGGIAVVVGFLAYSGALGWFGRLPGDIRLGGDNARLFIPFTSMLIVSIVASVVLTLIRRLL